MSFLQFHAIAATRGDGLRPELKALFERLAVHPFENGTIQSKPTDHAEFLREVRPIRPAARMIARRKSLTR